MRQAIHFVTVLALTLWGSTAMAIEKPKFQVLKHYTDFETREYPGYLVPGRPAPGDEA